MRKKNVDKLPRVTKLHPLVVGMTRVMTTRGMSLRAIARQELGITQQTLDEWVKRARKDRDFPLPPRRIPAISRLTGIPPYQFNNQLWPDSLWHFL